jgi:hypothetical protein
MSNFNINTAEAVTLVRALETFTATADLTREGEHVDRAIALADRLVYEVLGYPMPRGARWTDRLSPDAPLFVPGVHDASA